MARSKPPLPCVVPRSRPSRNRAIRGSRRCARQGAASASASSLLNWVKRLIAARRSRRAFGRGTLRFLYPAEDVFVHISAVERAGLSSLNVIPEALRFLLLGEPFHGTDRPYGFGRLRFVPLLELLRTLAHVLVVALAWKRSPLPVQELRGRIYLVVVRSLPEGKVRTRLCAGGRWIRTIGTPPNFFGRPSIRAQFTFRNINRLPCDRDRWFESISLQRGVGCKLDFLNHGRRRPFVCHDMAFGIWGGLSPKETRSRGWD
jgi:hypothetical protein